MDKKIINRYLKKYTDTFNLKTIHLNNYRSFNDKMYKKKLDFLAEEFYEFFIWLIHVYFRA